MRTALKARDPAARPQRWASTLWLARFSVCAVLVAAAALFLPARTAAADNLPPAPPRYFNDYANVTQPATRERLNRELEQFEKDQSSQIVVAIFSKLPEGAALEDFTQRTATAWKVGRAGLNNGAILFMFVADRKVRIEVGYGLEGSIPDAVAKRITSEKMRPALQQGNYDAALTAGVEGLMAAARGEYKGTGRTVAEQQQQRGGNKVGLLFLLGFVVVIIMLVRRASRGSVYGRRGYSRGSVWPGVWTSGGGGWSGGSGGGFGGGGGGFSGGGGSFGGGGASDSW